HAARHRRCATHSSSLSLYLRPRSSSSSSSSLNTPPTSVLSTLSLHDALPISQHGSGRSLSPRRACVPEGVTLLSGRFIVGSTARDRKSTRLNSSHEWISYAVFCLKKKNKQQVSQRGHRGSRHGRPR